MPIPQFNSNRIQAYCEHLCGILCDSKKCKEGFEAAIKLIDYVLKRTPIDRDRLDSQFTKKLVKTAFLLNQRKHNK